MNSGHPAEGKLSRYSRPAKSASRPPEREGGGGKERNVKQTTLGKKLKMKDAIVQGLTRAVYRL
jgi:hypothetical protein